MDQQIKQVLQMIPQPAFLTVEDVVCWHNDAACHAVELGEDLQMLLGENYPLYGLWDRLSPLQIDMELHGEAYLGAVQSYPYGELFVLQSRTGEAELSASVLLQTSIYLREQVQNLLLAGESIFSTLADEDLETPDGDLLNRSIYRILRLCGQLSDGGRILTEKFDPLYELTDLGSFFDSFVQELQPVMEEGGWPLRYVPCKERLRGEVDRLLLERAVYNLLSNAMQYSPKGSEIRLSLQKLGKLLCITVSDSGEGMSATLPAETSVQPVGDSRKGAGMGLELVRRIARMHGGALIYTDMPQGGTRVTFSIRLKRESGELQSPKLRADPWGGMHHGLVELSDVLKTEMYDPDRV